MDIPDDLRVRLVATVHERSRLIAIRDLRIATGCDFDHARQLIDALVPPPLVRHRHGADLYAFGAFDKALTDCLDGPDRYTPPRPGRRISLVLAEGIDERGAEELASVFGAKLTDVSTHALSPTRDDFELLVVAEYARLELEQLEKLRTHGFRFFLHVWEERPW